MKKNISAICGLTVLLSVLCAPLFVQATTTATSTQELIISIQQQIATLKVQIAALNTQLESLRQARGEVKETVKDIKGTLQMIKQLKTGMSGDDVKLLQEILATDSDVYPEKLITGYFGPITERAVKKLQQKMCLEQVGTIGPKTMAKINELLREGAGSSGKVPPGLLIAPGIQKKLCVISTPDTTAPIISGVSATSTTATSTQIQWITNEIANSRVYYSTSTPVVITASTPVVSSSDYVLNHSITLSGLTANTTYYYLVGSIDQSGNIAIDTEKSFTTLNQ